MIGRCAMQDGPILMAPSRQPPTPTPRPCRSCQPDLPLDSARSDVIGRRGVLLSRTRDRGWFLLSCGCNRSGCY